MHNITVNSNEDRLAERRPMKVTWIVGHKVHLKSDFLLHGINFTCIGLNNCQEEIKYLKTEAIVLLYKPNIEHQEGFNKVKTIAQALDVPYVLYSIDYNPEARALATARGFDDYHYGKLKDQLVKKFDMIRKIKDYKKDQETSQLNAEETSLERYSPVKRVFDIIVASSVLLLLSPVLVLIALIIKLESPGPIFYVSRRAGTNYKVFNFIKFRSMYQDAEARLQGLSKNNQYGEGVFIKIKDDPRVTPFGKILRKTSLDEIPQLINVLRGDMSIVGNRPLPLYEAEQLTRDHAARRFLAPAGVTGLWQVTKRGKDDMSDQERINLDIEYARKSSLIYDIRLIVNTIPAMLQKEAV
ncbi:MAG: sugar transferase [Marinoscillum sp.]